VYRVGEQHRPAHHAEIPERLRHDRAARPLARDPLHDEAHGEHELRQEADREPDHLRGGGCRPPVAKLRGGVAEEGHVLSWSPAVWSAKRAGKPRVSALIAGAQARPLIVHRLQPRAKIAYLRLRMALDDGRNLRALAQPGHADE